MIDISMQFSQKHTGFLSHTRHYHLRYKTDNFGKSPIGKFVMSVNIFVNDSCSLMLHCVFDETYSIR